MSKKVATLNARLFKSDTQAAKKAFAKTGAQLSGKLYGTLCCNRCYKPSLVVLWVGDDGYALDRVESNCKHIPDRPVIV